MKIIISKLQEFLTKLRKSFLRKSCSSVGKNLIVYNGIRIHYPERLSIGDNVALNNDVWINASGNVL
mgnify:CR=1 FL=1